MFYIYANGKSIFEPLDEELVIYEPKLTLEMGKAGALQFKMPPNHRYYNDLMTFQTQITVDYDDEEIFRGRVLTNTKDFNNIRSVYCEGDLAYLLDSVQEGEKYTGTVHELFRKIITAHNEKVEDYKKFTVGRITVDDRNVVVSGKSSEITKLDTKKFDYKQIVINASSNTWMNSFDYINNYIIAYDGGYLHTRRVGNETYIDLVKEYANSSSQVIEFGENLVDFTDEVSTDDMFTVLIPLGEAKGKKKKNVTIESVNNGSPELVDEEGLARYGRIVKTHSFGSVKKPKTLLENAKRYLAEHENAPSTFTVKAVDLHMIDPNISRIDVGDQVRVRSKIHDIDRLITCSKIEYDFSDPSNNTYTFGFPKQSLTERYRKDKSGGGGGGSKKSGGSSGGSGGDGDTGTFNPTDEILERFSDLTGGTVTKDDVINMVTEGIETVVGTGGEIETAINEATSEFYDAYIALDKESGTITLKAIAQELRVGKNNLKRITGIDIDAPAGEVNMYSMRQALDETIQNLARVQTKADENESRVTLTASYLADLDDKTSEHIAELVVRADANESAIEGKADKISFESLVNTVDNTNNVLQRELGIFLDGTQGNVNLQNLTKTVDENGKLLSQARADIKTHTDDISSTMQLLTSFTKDANEHLASIDLWANEQESGIKLMADKIEAQGKQINLKADDSLVLGMKKTLKRDCGIDVDATTGNVNLRNLSTTVDNQGKILSTARADLKTVTDAQKATATLFASFEKDTKANLASIKLTADSAMSQVELKADKTTIDSKLVRITGRLDADEADIKKLKTDYAEIDTLITNKAKVLFQESLAIKAAGITAKGISCDSIYSYGDGTIVGTLNTSVIRCSSALTAKAISINGETAATRKWVQDQNYMPGDPKDKTITVKSLKATDSITAKTLKATDNIQIGAQKVATQYWCMSEKKFITEDDLTWDKIKNKPDAFPPKAHHHNVNIKASFQWGHRHEKGAETSKTTGNIYALSTTKEITVKGSTDDNK